MISLADVRAAERVVRRHFPPTPLVPAPRLSDRVGNEIFLKLEAATPLRVFKIRGALNKLDSLTAAGMTGGVTAASAGNHGMAVAYAARVYGRPATIFVPNGANPQKVEAIRRLGAELVEAGHDYQAAYEACQAFTAERDLTLVHAYDDPAVIAGQGTIGLEVAVQLPDASRIYVGVGGGGLIGGVAAVLKMLRPQVEVVGVSPAGADSLPLSVAAGQLVEIERVATFADGLGARRPGPNTLALAQQYVDRFVRVTDGEIWESLAALLREERIVAEPAGVAALAAALKESAPGRRVVVVVSGANVSDAILAEVLRRIS